MLSGMVVGGVVALRMLSKALDSSSHHLSGWMGRKMAVALGEMRFKRQQLRVETFQWCVKAMS